MRAAFEGNEPIVRLLLEFGADTTATNKHGKTAAAYAQFRGFHEIEELLQQPQASSGALDVHADGKLKQLAETDTDSSVSTSEPEEASK